MSGSAIKIVNNQSVANSIIDGRFVNCDTVFDLESGSLKCDGAVVHSCRTLLRMKGQGPGNCRIDLRGLHIDNIQREGFKLVNHTNPTNSKHMITLDGILGPRLTNNTLLSNVKVDGTRLFGWKGYSSIGNGEEQGGRGE